LLSQFRSLVFLLVLLPLGLLAQQPPHTPPLQQTEPINNEGIIKLLKSGMTEDLVLNVIQQQPGNYAFGTNDLLTLKEAGVPERVITAMLAKSKGEPVATTSTAGKPMGPGSVTRPLINGTGLFYRNNHEYFELLPEELDWKTSGELKKIVSAGIVRKELNCTIKAPSSRNFLSNPTEIVIVPPTGVTLNSYVLLPLRVDKGRRECNVGPVNKKSGIAEGALPFGVEKIAENQYRMVLPSPLSPGEYGVLSVMPADNTNSGPSKMYTFRILEK